MKGEHEFRSCELSIGVSESVERCGHQRSITGLPSESQRLVVMIVRLAEAPQALKRHAHIIERISLPRSVVRLAEHGQSLLDVADGLVEPAQPDQDKSHVVQGLAVS